MSHESVHASTIRATVVPNLRRMSVEPLAAALVFGGVVQQRRDGFVFVAAGVEDDRGDAEEVGEVRDGGPFARLPLVCLRRVA